MSIIERLLSFNPKKSLKDPFLTSDAGEINNARLEHLATLGLDLHNKSVIELGAGIGRLTDFFLRRDNSVLVTEGRPELVKLMKKKAYKHANPRLLGVEVLDIEKAEIKEIELLISSTRTTSNTETPLKEESLGFQVIFCYGLLYHLSSPSSAIYFFGQLANRQNGLLLLETVIDQSTETFIQVNETDQSNQALGFGSRPNPEYVMQLIRDNFKYAYVSKTQPNHPDFQTESSSINERTGRSRMIFIGSNTKLDNHHLSSKVPKVFQKSE